MADLVEKITNPDVGEKFIILDESLTPINDETGFYSIVDGVRFDLKRILLKDWIGMSCKERASMDFSPLFLVSSSYNKITHYNFNFSSGVIRVVDSNEKEFSTEIDGLKFAVNGGTSEDLYVAGVKW